MKIDCLVIDDEKLARDLLLEFLEPYPEIEVIAECSKGQEAVEKIDKLKPKLIFLDVQMPGMNGFDVLEAITHKPYVIFTTAYDQYAIQAFDKNAVDYVLKPLDEERFKLAIKRATDRISAEKSNVEDILMNLQTNKKEDEQYSSHLFVQKSEKLLNLDVNDIVHLEASGDYTVLTTKNDQYLSSSGIGKLEEKLDPNKFIRIHRSTIINLSYLKEIEKHFNGGLIVKMENGKSFPVSRTYAKQIRKKVV
ncbi:LytTR family DNA-binding domain-containing protein [Fulvivirga maritima]|uniref:LytR/AlgR family response regulator transcription factor n=1 Tax=Fulvivirga maritima TaxID=2904247 RepID=UPI001F18CA26|nr:LytTR family DNA-binding domain-containing protein [Fulvivirga maritima]UII28811.1 LytTR family DNA-binding domain-containing protein [Fulvivirga maritima]